MGTFVRTLAPDLDGGSAWPALRPSGGRYAAFRPAGSGTSPVGHYTDQHRCALWDHLIAR
ncbi:hypothetical protein NKH77_01820 [Streptomyces sp. M19]